MSPYLVSCKTQKPHVKIFVQFCIPVFAETQTVSDDTNARLNAFNIYFLMPDYKLLRVYGDVKSLFLEFCR